MNFLFRIKALWAAVQTKAVSIGVAIAAFVAVVLGHKLRVKQAKRKGVRKGKEQEQNRINAETAKTSQQMKERADALHKAANDIAEHELVDRLRSQRDRNSNR